MVIQFVSYNGLLIHQFRIEDYFWNDKKNNQKKSLLNAWNFCCTYHKPQEISVPTVELEDKFISVVSDLFK